MTSERGLASLLNFLKPFLKGNRNTVFTFGRKNDSLLFCLFVATLSDVLAYLKKIEALIELRKMLLWKRLYDIRLGNCPTANP